jgi:hypothetical protein
MENLNELIDQLFESDHFKEKLNTYISENLEIRQRQDSYSGTTDEMTFFIGDHEIVVDRRSYGY